MILSVHQPQYLPWLGYFDKIARSDAFVFLDKVQYKHREFQNRNKICTAAGWIWLTVPVITKRSHEQLIDDVLIDNSFRWQEKHWRSIVSNYNNAEFFKDYYGFFEDMYVNKKWEKLCDLNIYQINYFCSCLDIKTKVYFESQLGTSSKSTERIIELCKKTKADIYFSGSGGKGYLDEKRFSDEGIELNYQRFNHPQYKQCFFQSGGFNPYMSVIDLLFNKGANSRKILMEGL